MKIMGKKERVVTVFDLCIVSRLTAKFTNDIAVSEGKLWRNERKKEMILLLRRRRFLEERDHKSR